MRAEVARKRDFAHWLRFDKSTDLNAEMAKAGVDMTNEPWCGNAA